MKRLLLILFAIFLIASPVQGEFFKDVIVTSPTGIWTDSRAYTTLNAAITAIGASEQDLYIAKEEIVTTLTIPANIRLHFVKGGSIANSNTLTINTKNIHADHQIFTGAGVVNFIANSEVRTRWFEDFETAITQTSNDTVTLTVDTADTLLNSATVGNNVLLKWNASNLITIAAGQTLSNIGDISAPSVRLFTISGNITFRSSSSIQEVDANWFGSSLTTLGLADTAAAAAGKSLTFSGPWVIDTDLTLSSHIKALSGTDLQIATTKTLTINGSLDAGLYQIFSLAGTGAVRFGAGSITHATTAWFGATTAAGFQSAMDSLTNVGRCKLTCPYGTYTWTTNTGVNFVAGVEFDAQGSTFAVTLSSGTDVAFDMRDNTALQNATINLTVATAGADGGERIPILIGDYGPGTGYDNIDLENITMDSTGCVASSVHNGIHITGDSHNIRINNFVFNGADKVTRAILIHWGGADDPTTLTTHPYNISIENCKVNNLYANADSGAVFVSGAYNIKVKNLDTNDCYRAFRFFAGDYADYYAAAAQKGLIGSGISVENVTAIDAYVIASIDGAATVGVPAAAGYEVRTPITFKNVSGIGKVTTSNSGFVIENGTYGVVLDNCSAKSFVYHGVSCTGGTKNLRILGGYYGYNGYQGIRIRSTSVKTISNVTIDGPVIEMNNATGVTGDDRAGILVGTSSGTVSDVLVQNVLFGAAAGETQYFGLRVDANALRVKSFNNRIVGLAAGGVGISLASATTYAKGHLMRDNSAETGITLYGGVVPVGAYIDSSGNLSGSTASIAKTADYALVAADQGVRFNNTGAGGTITYALPVSVVGMRFSFVRTAAQIIRIDPNGTEYFRDSSAGKYKSMDTIGAYMTVECFVTGIWTLTSSVGTIANEP